MIAPDSDEARRIAVECTGLNRRVGGALRIAHSGVAWARGDVRAGRLAVEQSGCPVLCCTLDGNARDIVSGAVRVANAALRDAA